MTADPTTLVLVRHGVTAHTSEKRFSGGLAGADPGLSEEGRAQISSVGEWLRSVADRVDAIVASPVRRTRESAGILGELWGLTVHEEAGFAEMEFGSWDARTFLDVADHDRDALEGWLGSLDVAPGGTGESLRTVEERVLAGLSRLLGDRAGQTVVVVSHVTPIKTLVARAVEAPLTSMFRMELAPASVSVVAYHPPGQPGPAASLRLYNSLPPDRGLLGEASRW